MTARRLPEVLVIAGLALGLVAVVIALRQGRMSAQETTSTTTSQGSTTTAAPIPGPMPVDLRAIGVTPVSATLAWHTGSATTALVGVGTAALGPARWISTSRPTLRHAVPLGALAFGRTYRAWITSIDGSGARASATLDFTTPPPTAPVAASVAGGVMQLDGQPWFPLLAWGECSTLYDSGLATGISLFASNPCGGLGEQLKTLDGRALSAGVDGDVAADPATVVGNFYPDEADAHGMTGASLPTLPSGLRLLTLSSHFYDGAAPLPEGRGMYPGLVARADVVGFDLYPLQGWCQPNRLADVEAAQRQLVALAGGKPTFQWIESAGMNCPHQPGLAVTPTTVRAESWLAIVGGAQGLGFFPAAWTANVEKAIQTVGDETAALAATLASPALPVVVDPADGPVRATAWSGGGALLVAAVNSSRTPVKATLRVGGLGDRALTVLEESRSVTASGAALTDSFGPLQVHLYLAPTSGT